MRPRRLVLLAPLLLGACAPAERPAEARRSEPTDCGLRGAEAELAARRRSWERSGRRGPVPMSFPARACALPATEDVALACRLPGVRRLRCHFRDPERTQAACSFEAPVPEWRPARGEFTFRFHVGGDGGVHADHFVFWLADRTCGIEGRGPGGGGALASPTGG